MENNTKAIAIAAAVGVGGLLLWKVYKDKSKGEQNKTIIQNDTAADLNADMVQQALNIKAILDPMNIVGSKKWCVPVNPGKKDVALLMNQMLTVTNWKKLQDNFSSLCNNQYSLTQALQDGLNAENYQLAIRLANAKKAITVDDCFATLYNEDNPDGVQVDFKKGTLIGAVGNDTEPLTLSFVNGYKYVSKWLGLNTYVDVTTGVILKDFVKTVQP